MKRAWLRWILPLALVAAIAVPASAGVLTSASYTYMLRGREVELPVDILTVQGAVLAPAELLAAFGLTPAVEGDAVRLERGPVAVELQLGSDLARVDGKERLLKAAPMLVAGRVFVPAEVLPDLGASLTVDGRFVLLSDYQSDDLTLHDGAAPPPLEATIRDGATLARLSVTALTPELLASRALAIPWGTRLRLMSLLEGRTLLLVTWQNQSLKATALDPARLMLIGGNGRQYDYLKLEVPVDGAATAPVAPGAHATAVLAFPAVDGAAFDLYYDGAAGLLGRLSAR